MRARKRFGQHFLEAAWVAKVVDAIRPAATDRVIEIGPGRAALTEKLADRVERLVAVEVDRDLAAELEARHIPRLTVVTADVLEVDLGAVAQRELDATSEKKARVVGNLPYNISSPILFRLLDVAGRTRAFQDATLMLQKEVADRLVAQIGTSDYGVLTISTALGADVDRLMNLPPGAFRPMPKVHSSVVRLTFRPPTVPIRDVRLLTDLVRAVFTQRRKTLANALATFASARGTEAKTALAEAGIEPSRRPQTLAVVDFARLADTFAEPGHGIFPH
jgi:16S rRNA (adenine1518-N6/adenine1519-N6)-dimethyltransferase